MSIDFKKGLKKDFPIRGLKGAIYFIKDTKEIYLTEDDGSLSKYGGGHDIYDETTVLSKKNKLRFVGESVSVTNDTDSTVVTINGSSESLVWGDFSAFIPNLISAITNLTGDKVILTFDRKMNDPSGLQNQFNILVNGSSIPIVSATLESDTTKIDLNLTTQHQIWGNNLPNTPDLISDYPYQYIRNNNELRISPCKFYIKNDALYTFNTISVRYSLVEGAWTHRYVDYITGVYNPLPTQANYPIYSDSTWTTIVFDKTTPNYTKIEKEQTVTISYTKGTVTSESGGYLHTFTNQAVTNNVA